MCYENFAVNQKANIFVSYVIKEFAHAFSCAYIKLWMHLGSFPACIHNSIYMRANHEQILIIATVLTFHTSQQIGHFGG